MKAPARTCGDAGSRCSLCCKLLPVLPLEKKANTWCTHAKKGAGCAIYGEHPNVCQAWRCLWIEDPSVTGPLARPDKAHYVIDMAADIIGVNGRQIGVMVVWADPGYPNAWRLDHELASLMEDQARQGFGTLIRFGTARCRVVLLPPLIDKRFEYEGPPTREDFSHEEKLAFFRRNYPGQTYTANRSLDGTEAG